MRNAAVFDHENSHFQGSRQMMSERFHWPKRIFIGLFLVLALLAFEMFNFDTTRFALQSFLGDISFAGLGWAAILAIAFCAIDFAGLARLFTPERGSDEPKEIWYLTGAWLLGASMNAVMTWWAVSLTLLNHEFGNEVLSRQQLLTIVPMFVAALVWLTRILFIGSLAVAGEKLLRPVVSQNGDSPAQAVRLKPVRLRANGPRRRDMQTTGQDLDPIELSQPAVQRERVDGFVQEPALR